MSDWEDDQYTSCENDTQRESIDYDQLMNDILDLSIEADDRKNKLDNLASNAPLILTDVVSNFISGYIENESSAISDVLSELCFYPKLTLTARIKCAQTINSSYNLLLIIQDEVDKDFYFRDPDFNWTLVIDLMIDILTSPSENENIEIKCKAQTIIYTFFSTASDETYQYKIVNYIWGRTFPTNLLLDEEEMTKLEKISDETIIQNCLQMMFKNYLSIDSKTIVFITQMLKSKNWLEDTQAEKLLDLAASESNSTNQNKIANICDIFLEHPNSEIAKKAKQLLMSLEGVSSTNIYTSSQNIHQVQADIENFIEKLCEQPQADWSVVKTFILSKTATDEVLEKLSLALSRFEMDKGLYSSKSLSLQSMLCRVWSAIQQHEHQEELNKRLIEEISEMADTCSTGHLLRLVNVFSGFEDGIRIGVFDELSTVINYRITKIVKSQPEELQTQIVDELGESNQTGIVTKLYGPIAILHDELWNDYKPILDQQTFTDYFRTIVTKWTS